MFKIDERLPKESAKDYVVRQLVYNIVHINLTPGQQLDSDEISELLNVSKNPIPRNDGMIINPTIVSRIP